MEVVLRAPWRYKACSAKPKREDALLYPNVAVGNLELAMASKGLAQGCKLAFLKTFFKL